MSFTDTKGFTSEENQGDIVIYQTEDGETKIDVRFVNETVWLSLDQLSVLFERNKSTISRHLKNIFEEGELERDSVVAKIATTAADGKTYRVDYYNLDAIISLGYRVQSRIATQFRRWATERLKEYMVKGFTMDDERLKKLGGGNSWTELLARIRDTRSSEKVMYRQVLDLSATSVDYDPRSSESVAFFKMVQNKLHYAAHGHTAAEVIYDRVDNEKPLVGMTNFKGDYITKDDVKIAKNYLSEIELQRLNLLVSQFLDYAELQALEQIPMAMQDWIDALDNQIVANRRKLLEGKDELLIGKLLKKLKKNLKSTEPEK